MTILFTIFCTLLWVWFGARSHYYWENKRKRDSGNMNQTWQKHQVRELINNMISGPAAYFSGKEIYRQEMENRK